MLLEDRIHDLQNHLDPIITLRGPNGSTLAVADNDISGDPLLCQRFDRAGDYTLEIRDVRYKGDRDWVYCVEINDRPFVRTVFPLAVAAGKRPRSRPIGYQLPEQAAFAWDVPANWSAGLHDVQLPLGNTSDEPGRGRRRPMCRSFDEAARSSRHGPDGAVDVDTPVGINGRLLKEGESDVYSFRAQRGQTFTFEAVSRREGSPLDSALRILDARGRTLHGRGRLSEDGRLSADALIEGWSPPADGTYAIEIRDLLQRGGPAFVYFLKITPPEPEFELFLDTDKTELSPGTSGVIFVNSVRKNGFDGDIALSVEGLPPEVTGVLRPHPRRPPRRLHHSHRISPRPSRRSTTFVVHGSGHAETEPTARKPHCTRSPCRCRRFMFPAADAVTGPSRRTRSPSATPGDIRSVRAQHRFAHA